jgi:hypothetical protein
VVERGSVGEWWVRFIILHHNAGFSTQLGKVGGKMTINWTGGLFYRNRPIHIVSPFLHSYSSSAHTMWSLTVTSAPTLCLIKTSAHLHSFPIICELISPASLMDPVSHPVPSLPVMDRFACSIKPGGRWTRPSLVWFIIVGSSVMAITVYVKWHSGCDPHTDISVMDSLGQWLCNRGISVYIDPV